MSSLTIVRPGLFTTVQDRGRWGFQAQGVPTSGAMDLYSHRLANLLVGNSNAAATLEVTLTGPEIQFHENIEFSVAGAEFSLSLDRTPIPMNQRVSAPAGSRLSFGPRLRGARAYVAVRGGVEVPLMLGSRATHLLSRMGGLEGRALRANDVLLRGQDASPDHGDHRGVQSLELPDGGATLRMIPVDKTVDITGKRFTVSPRSDRMGYRLDGASVGATSSGELISGPVPTGAIQLLPDGRPILLMADHGTTGGYAIAGSVISADLPIAGQLAPGDWLEFASCSLEEADRALRRREALLTGARE